VFEQASERHTDVIFGKVDTEEAKQLAAEFEIRAIPTLVVMRDGIILAAQSGALPAKALDALVDEIRALDMDQIRRELDAAEQAQSAPEVV
jgi:thioredoxin-like negative regulator of GroEL